MEGYRDITAWRAMNDLDRQQQKKATRAIRKMKEIADREGLEILGRVRFRDKETGAILE